MNAFRKTVELVSSSLRRPFRAVESDIDRSDREAVERALRDYKADPSQFVSQEELEANLRDRAADR